MAELRKCAGILRGIGLEEEATRAEGKASALAAKLAEATPVADRWRSAHDRAKLKLRLATEARERAQAAEEAANKARAAAELAESEAEAASRRRRRCWPR